jgi:hypothetical protein
MESGVRSSSSKRNLKRCPNKWKQLRSPCHCIPKQKRMCLGCTGGLCMSSNWRWCKALKGWPTTLPPCSRSSSILLSAGDFAVAGDDPCRSRAGLESPPPWDASAIRREETCTCTCLNRGESVSSDDRVPKRIVLEVLAPRRAGAKSGMPMGFGVWLRAMTPTAIPGKDKQMFCCFVVYRCLSSTYLQFCGAVVNYDMPHARRTTHLL